MNSAEVKAVEALGRMVSDPNMDESDKKKLTELMREFLKSGLAVTKPSPVSGLNTSVGKSLSEIVAEEVNRLRKV